MTHTTVVLYDSLTLFMERMKQDKQARKQLDALFKGITPLAEIPFPPKGWLRSVRDSLGMTARQLGKRLGIAQQAVSRIEKEEPAGAVTIKTMRRLAQALDCDFVYGFVPRTSLEETIARQARKVALLRFGQAAQCTNTENEPLTDEEKEKVISDLAEALIRTLPPTFWDD